MKPQLSDYFSERVPSVIRLAQIEFAKRKEKKKEPIEAINVAIGNVSLPMHPAMIARMKSLGSNESPFRDGVVEYTPTVGIDETRNAFLNILASSGFNTEDLYVQITDGGSMAMEIVVVGLLGEAGSEESPLLVIDPAYTNYISFARRLGRKIISVRRSLNESGRFSLPPIEEIEETVRRYKPAAMLVIPYDNPSGQLYSYDTLTELAKLCVRYNMWMISDEAYRELYYTTSDTREYYDGNGSAKEGSEGFRPVSIWGLSEDSVPGIKGRRISIESASKVWNACGLRIGAIITDNDDFHEKAVAEATANLCPNAIGQYIFGGLAHETRDKLKWWYERQRKYYREMMVEFFEDIRRELPGIIVSEPMASIYSVVDVRDIVDDSFDAYDFVMYCAREGVVEVAGGSYTLLVAPMEGFYRQNAGSRFGKTQMRIAYVETPDRMKLVPLLFKRLLTDYVIKIGGSLKNSSVMAGAI